MRVDRLVILLVEIQHILLLGQHIITHRDPHQDQQVIAHPGLHLIQLLIQLVGQHHIHQAIV